jgi:hypothetical protein
MMRAGVIACEGQLEADVDHLGNVRATLKVAAESVVDAGHEGLREAADELGAAGEGEAVAVERPDNRDDADGVEDLSQNREHVLGADEAAVEQGEAGDGHQQHENG